MDSIQEYSDFGSHIPILRKLFYHFDIKRILEFGMGDFSTTFFLDHDPELLVSLEMNDEWLAKCQTKHPNHHCLRLEGSDMNDYLEKTPAEHFDLIFIDGPQGDRWRQLDIAWTGHKSKFVVAHDRTCATLEYHRVQRPPEWYEFYCQTGNFTAITGVSCADRTLKRLLWKILMT